MRRTGLVLEGGSMRGMFTCGIIDIFLENNVTFDGMAGTSAGAAFGCNLKSRQIGRPIRYNKRFCNDKRYVSYESWIKTGNLYNAEFCYDEMIHKYDLWDDKTFAANPMEFYAVATDIRTGKPVYHKCETGDDADVQWIRASSSMPVFSKPVQLEGGEYLDGGMTDPIPLKFMQRLGYEKIVVIETQPANYVKMPQKFMGVICANLKDYPKAIQAMKKRHLLYNRQKAYIRELERQGRILALRPDSALNIKAAEHDPEELERVYQLGRAKGEEKLETVRKFLAE